MIHRWGSILVAMTLLTAVMAAGASEPPALGMVNLDAASGFWPTGLLAGSVALAGALCAVVLHQRARFEAAIRAKDTLLRTIDMHAIVSVADRGGRITQVNDAFCRISGYRRDELLGQNHRLINSGLQSPAFWVEMWRSIGAGKPWRGEVCNRAKDGSLYWVDTVVAPIVGADGRTEKYISIRTDITASKTAARDLARERLALVNIIEGTSAGTWQWDLETDVLHFNERWAQLIGHTLAELGSTTMATWRQRSHPDDIARTEALLKQHFRGELPALECENRVRHRDGHWVWVQTRGKVFSRTTDGRPRWMAGTHMDISQRKEAEAALRASQDFLDHTGRIGGVGGWALDVATQALQWSDQTCRIHDRAPGHRPTLAEAIAHYAPEARPVIAASLQHAIDTGTGFDLELAFITATGRSIWVRVVGEVDWVDGRALRLMGAIQDISARRAMELMLRRNAELVSSVIENLPCGLSVFDGELNLVVANGAFRRLLDLPATLFETPPTRFEDIIGFNAARGEYGGGDLATTVQTIVERARAPSVAHQFERERPDGTPLEIRGAPMPGGGFVTTYTDISERRRAQAEVQRAGDLLRGSIDALDDAFSLFDADDRLVVCNQRYRDLYPLCADLIVPGNSFEQIIRGGAARGQYAAAIDREESWVQERLALHRQPSSRLMTRLGDGRTMRIVERRMPDGHTVGFRVDITEMVRATEAAQQASVAKSQFLANMSHEIRTPMNAILGMLALLRKTELSARQADYAVKTEGAARSLLGLLNEILDFSKVEAGKMTLDAHPFRFDQLLRDLSVIVSANVAAKPVEVLFDIDPALPRQLVGDAMRLQQVLTNLTGNAIKFTARGEVVLSVRVVRQDAAGVTMEIAVRDTGIGIAPENHARIFSGFTQAEASMTRRFGGTGLGVAISQRLVALMGGELRLDSALGQGSRFHFNITLPVAGDRMADGNAPRPAPGTPLRALVVDDNPTARAVLQRMGDSLGWSIAVADSGAAALALLQDEAARGLVCDVVFVDWQMPGLDGWATSQRIHALDLGGKVPVIVMVTAHGREMLAQRSAADQALIDGFLVKPVTPSMLFDAIADVGLGRLPAGPARPASTTGTRRLAGLRLLLVEDNLNNQQVARELLEDEGASVQIAGNGKESVEAVAAADPPFDVVLMDLQMPVMDGFTATRVIRDDLGLRALPIVAMTANAMASDRDACLAAGMNEHVGKPFDLNHLVQVLLRQAGRDAAPLAGAKPASDARQLPVTVGAAAAAAGVQIDTAIARLGGKAEIYRLMLQRFVDDLARLPAELQGLASAANSEAAADVLHTVKGVAATLGADSLAATAADGEKALRAGAAPAARRQRIGVACAAFETAGPALQALLDTLRPATPPTPAAPAAGFDRPALRQGLHHLASLLRNSDMGALEALSSLQAQFAGALGERLRALENAVAGLDFDHALCHCTKLLEELES